MTTSVIYTSSLVYELTMLLLYGRHYPSRYRVIAELIPEGVSVLDVCCGPAVIYDRHLRKKRVTYTGLDVNPRFIARVRRHGGQGLVWDIGTDAPLPIADYVMMHASLYHFLPGPSRIVESMIAAARKKVIIAEPIRNLTTIAWRLRSALGARPTSRRPIGPCRFTRATLDRTFATYQSKIERSFLIPGAKEKVFVLRGAAGPP